ncbi:MAG TPA: flagellar export protein FliJ [Solirubrobacteraceae bacterium]|nr:flagellar export protein FliJ [Solirubrobacteraceae bacterium]
MSARSFKFRLERVRALRERAEQRASEELAASLAHQQRGEEQLRAAAKRVAAAREGRRATAQATGADLLAMQAYLERTQRAEHAAALDLGRREAEVDARRDALVHAAREHRALSRLEQRRRAEHAERTARIEGAFMDEVALGVHRRSVSA